MAIHTSSTSHQDQRTQRSTVALDQSGKRLDQVCQQLFPEFSRARLQQWIKDGFLTLDGNTVKPNTKLRGGELIVLQVEPEEQGDWQPEAMNLDLVHEDDALLVINKPAGLVVHPAAGNASGTLLNGLIHHLPEQINIPRAGIVHRLDKDTTGLMVVTKSLSSQASLVEQLQSRQVSRAYLAVVHGSCPAAGEITGNIGRDPGNRKKMAVLKGGGKEARTHFQKLKSLGPFSLVRLKLETGRTHQIRVHMSKLGYPLVGDPLYGKRLAKNVDVNQALRRVVECFARQALHAYRLGLSHPVDGAEISWFASPPDDMVELISSLDETLDRQAIETLLQQAWPDAKGTYHELV